MPFSLTTLGEIETTEARERALNGWVAGTIDDTHIVDDSGSFDDAISVNVFFHSLGIHFTATDNFISIFNDGSIEAYEFIEGSRLSLDDQATVTTVFLREVT